MLSTPTLDKLHALNLMAWRAPSASSWNALTTRP